MADQSDVAATLNNLAISYLRQGRYREAELSYKRALAIYDKIPGRGHRPGLARTLDGLANLYQTEFRLTEAEGLIGEPLPSAKAYSVRTIPRSQARSATLPRFLSSGVITTMQRHYSSAC